MCVAFFEIVWSEHFAVTEKFPRTFQFLILGRNLKVKLKIVVNVVQKELCQGLKIVVALFKSEPENFGFIGTNIDRLQQNWFDSSIYFAARPSYFVIKLLD